MQMMEPSLPCFLAVSLSCLVLQLQCAPPSPGNQTSPGSISNHSPTNSVTLQYAESPGMVRKLVQTYILIGLGLCLAFAVFGCCFAFVCCPKLRRNVVKGRVVGGPPAGLQLHQPRPTAPEIVVEPQAAAAAVPADQPAAAVAAASVESLAADSASSSSQATEQQGTPPPSYDTVQRNRASRYAEGGRGGQQGGAERPVHALQAHNPPERPVSSKF